MVDVSSFIRKWHGRRLQDDGCYVSKEFHSFQVSFFNAMKKIAKGIGAEVINPSYGHYDMSGFIKRGDKYVYFDYSALDRTYVQLKDNSSWHQPLLIRTAKHEKDFTGGANNYASFERCEILIDRLLNSQ
jgi:hypothetical protein